MAGSYIFQRELGGSRGVGSSLPSAIWGHNPLAFERECSSDPALVRRLACMAELPTHASSMSNVSWSEHGDFMASGGEDCRILVWSAEHQRAVHTLDVGHIAPINCVRFLPASNNEQIISCGNDRQVRLVSLRKNAVKPFCHHRGKVKTAMILDPNIFMSGSDDGTVRQVDIREPLTGSQQDHGSSGHDNINVIADQRQERTGCAKTKVGVNSIAVMPLNPHIFVTGGSDALVRLYDRRMASSNRGSSPSKVRWVSCFVPTHLKGALITPRPFVSPSRSIGVSGVAFTGDGQSILASYTSEQIYMFSATEHARPPRAFSASVDSAPHRAAGPQRTRARHNTEGRARNAEAAQAGNNVAAGTGAAGVPRGSFPAEGRGVAQQRPTRSNAAAAAAAAAPSAAAAEPRPLADLLQRFRPVFQHPRTAQSRQPLRRGASPAQSVGGAARLNEEAAQQQQQQPAGEVLDAASPSDGHDAGRSMLTAAVAVGARLAAAGGGADVPAPAERAAQAPEDQSPQEATREQQSPEDGQGPSNHRPAGWRAGSRPASFTGSALPPMAHSIGQLPNGAAARGTPSTTAACAQARLSPDLQVATSPARRGPQLRSQLGANIGGDNAAPGDGHPAPAPHDDHAPLRAARRSKRRLAGGDATDSQAPASKARRGPVHAGAVDSLPAAEDAAGPSGRAAAPPLDADSPDDTAQEVRSAEAARPDAPTEPVEVAGNPHCAGGQRAHALRPAGSTMAAEGHVFAVANSSAERPTASTGTSRPRDIPRPRREDGRESELQSRLHAERHGPAAPAAAQPGAAAAPGPRSVDPRSLPFPVPLPRRGRSPAAPAASSAMFGIPEWPAPPPAAGANGHAQRSAQVAAVASSVSAAERARAGPSRAGSSQQEGRHNDAAAAGEASQGGGPTGYGVASPDRDGGGRADSLPSSAAAIVGEDREPDTVGRPAARLSRRRGVDSAVGAIVETGDGDEGDGEEVDESGMFQRSFSGHYNRVGCKEVALMGSHSQYVVSGSDDGHIFVWQRGTGQLVNLLRSSDTGVSCVAPHPHLPMLASCGQDPVVRLWSPEAAEMASLENAEAVMRRNAAELTERAAAAAGPPALWLNMIAPPGLAAELEQRPRSPRGHQADRGDNPVRCSLM